MIVRTHLLVLLSAIICLLAAPAAAQTALERGEILVQERKVKGVDVPEIIVKAVIKAPPEDVWDVIQHCGRYKKTMPRIVMARELSRKGNIVICNVTVDVPFPYSDTTAVTRCVHTEDKEKGRYTRRWDLVKGAKTSYIHNRGSWVITRFQGKKDQSYVVYRAIAKPKAWVPGWIKTMAQKSGLPKMIKRIRKITEKK